LTKSNDSVCSPGLGSFERNRDLSDSNVRSAIMAGVMSSPRKWRLPVFALAVTCVVSTLPAEVYDGRWYHGKRVQCVHGGFWAGAMASGTWSCGTQGYARVFTGTVRSVVELSDTDKQLQIIPDDVFVGAPIGEVTATVNQACLPENQREIQPGDKWLFYLQSYGFPGTDGTASELDLPFDSPSKPLAQAQDDVETLRHLARLTEHQSIITGNVERIGETYDNVNPVPVPNRKIVAKGLFGEYVAFTNKNGHFEFDLPPDTYDVTAETEPGLREAESVMPRSSTFIANGACLNTNFTMLTDGRLAGRVTTRRGKPASHVKVSIIPISPIRPQFSVVADEQGRFEVTGRQPGSYIVGIGLLAPYNSREWKTRVYYPGVRTREAAKTIELGDGEWRTDIDFKVLPTPSAP
jgi:hypothetical protein